MWDTAAGERRPRWQTVETEFDIDLFGVVQTVKGPYAIGASGTLVADHGNGWKVVFDDGPATRDSQLRAADVTTNGRRVWMVGTSGVIACYDVEQQRKFDYSYPEEMTSTWEAVAIAGEKGYEKGLAANGSGEVLPFLIDGFDVQWGRLRKPVEKGSNIAALAATPDGVGFAIDTSGNAFKTSQEAGWEDIGVLDSQVKLHDIYAGANQRVYIAAGDGRVYRYDDSARDWTPIGVAEGVALRSIDVEVYEDNTGEMVVIGGDGCLYQRIGDERWVELPSPTDATLRGLSIGGELDVAVGTNGTVIERPQEPRHDRTSPDGDPYDDRGENYDEPTDRRREDGDGTDDGGDGSGGEDSTQGGSDGGSGDDGQEDGSGDSGQDGGSSDDDQRDDSDSGNDSDELTTGDVLVLLADALDVQELSSAAGYNVDEVEQTLINLAEQVDAKPTEVRAALAVDGEAEAGE